MACREIHRWLFLWVDREREELPSVPVEKHFEECPSCRDRALEVERIVMMVRERCHRTAAPTGLAERIRSLIEDG